MEKISPSVVAMNLKLARTKANMTIEELAKKSGTSSATISFIENAKNETRIMTLGKLANALGIDVKVLLGIE